jgi:hypothetical protein
MMRKESPIADVASRQSLKMENTRNAACHHQDRLNFSEKKTTQKMVVVKLKYRLSS